MSVDAEVEGKGAASPPQQARTPQYSNQRLQGIGALEAIPEDAVQRAGAIPAAVSAWLRENFATELTQKETQQRQLEETRVQGLTGFARYVETKWRKGELSALFLANTTEASGPEAAAFAKKVLFTTGTDRFTFGPNLGQGLCGRIDEVTRAGFPGTFALKTIKKVSGVHVLSGQQTLFTLREERTAMVWSQRSVSHSILPGVPAACGALNLCRRGVLCLGSTIAFLLHIRRAHLRGVFTYLK